MYIATQSFTASSGRFFLKGDKISKLWYFFLPKRDKVMFQKESDFVSTNISKDKIVKPSNSGLDRYHSGKNDVYTPPRRYMKQSNSHYGYEPEPGYSNDHITYHPFPTMIDNTPSNHSIPHFNGWGEGDSGGAGSTGSWGHNDSHSHSHDSGHSYSDSSSSDSSSCDSGGGDCGGGCDGGGGGGD